MRKYITLLLLIFGALSMNAQKTYIVCPDNISPVIAKKTLDGDKIELTIKDKRTNPLEKTVNRCSGSELIYKLRSAIENSFPKGEFEAIDEYSSDPENGKVYINIDIIDYQSTFLIGMWYARVTFEVIIIDYRSDTPLKHKTFITKENKALNINGRRTGEKKLLKSLNEVSPKLLQFISDSLNS